MDILSKANSIVSDYDKIMQQMMDSEIMLNQEKMTSLSRQKSALEESYQLCKKFIDLNKQLSEVDEMKDDKEYEELAKEESVTINNHIALVEEKLKKILISDDPNDNKNAIIEIRAGTGGDEAGLFASDLMRMYSRYAEDNNLKVNIMDIHETGVGGLKSATFSIEGPKAYGVYKYEGGVHRVQRIPKTESSILFNKSSKSGSNCLAGMVLTNKGSAPAIVTNSGKDTQYGLKTTTLSPESNKA